MDEFPRVLAPVVPLGEIEGVTVLLLSVELWPEEITIRMAAAPGQIARQQVARHREQFEAWADQPKRDRDALQPPEAPAERLLRPSQVDLDVRDDVGTQYAMKAAQTGGTDTEWRADWWLHPGLPGNAGRLRLHLAREGVVSEPVDLDVGAAR